MRKKEKKSKWLATHYDKEKVQFSKDAHEFKIVRACSWHDRHKKFQSSMTSVDESLDVLILQIL